MQSCHPVDIHGEEFVLFGLAGSLAFCQHLVHFHNHEDCSSGECSLNVISINELVQSGSTTSASNQLICLGQIGEKVVARSFASRNSISLLEEHT